MLIFSSINSSCEVVLFSSVGQKKYLAGLRTTRETTANTFRGCLARIAFARFVVRSYYFLMRLFFSAKNCEKPNRISRQLLSPRIESFICGRIFWLENFCYFLIIILNWNFRPEATSSDHNYWFWVPVILRKIYFRYFSFRIEPLRFSNSKT